MRGWIVNDNIKLNWSGLDTFAKSTMEPAMLARLSCADWRLAKSLTTAALPVSSSGLNPSGDTILDNASSVVGMLF